MKVAIDARLFSRSMTGDTSYWRGLILALTRSGSNAELLLFSNSPRPREIPDNSRLSWINLSGADRWWSLYKFPIQARRAGANVIHTQYNLSPLVGRRGVTTIHDVSFFIGPQWFSPKDRLVLRSQIPRTVEQAARVITVSETSRREIEHYVPSAKGKTRVVYNALGENINPMPMQEARQVLGAFGLPSKYVFSVGTRWPRKNLKLAVEAANLAEVPIVVTGKAGWGGDSSGAIYTDYVDDQTLTALYQCAALYLAPSFHEGFGIPLLEAFACQCPVLCSAGGALPEVGGEAVRVANSFEPSEWAAAIRELLQDSSKLDEMRRAGLSRVVDFSWDKSAQQTLGVYGEVANDFS